MNVNEARVSSIEKVLRWMDLSPEGQRCKARSEQQAWTEREKILERMGTLHTKQLLHVSPLQRDVETAQARVHDAQHALLAATAQVNEAYRVYREAYLSVSAELDRCQAQLCALADERIKAFIREIQEEFETHRHTLPKTSALPPRKDKFSDNVQVRISSNIRFVERWSKRIHEVISLAQGLKLQNVADLDQELAALRDSIPKEQATDLEYTEYTIPARNT
jgi:hypothetical protein